MCIWNSGPAIERGMSGKRAKKSAPRGPTVLDEVLSHCSDLPELLVAGLFDGIKSSPPKNGKEQNCNANLIATYRVLNSEFRTLMDARIIEEFTAFKECAFKLFDATYQLLLRRDTSCSRDAAGGPRAFFLASSC